MLPAWFQFLKDLGKGREYMYICTSPIPRTCKTLHKGLSTDFWLVFGIQCTKQEQNIKK